MTTVLGIRRIDSGTSRAGSGPLSKPIAMRGIDVTRAYGMTRGARKPATTAAAVMSAVGTTATQTVTRAAFASGGSDVVFVAI